MITETNDQKFWTLGKVKSYPHINEVFFIVLVVLCFIGDILGEISEHFAVFYWLLMVPVFFFITLLDEQAKELKTGLSIAHFYRFNLIYWTSSLLSIFLILFLWHAEALDAKGSALAIHIIVAQTIFLLGILAGLRFYLIGLFLFISAGMTIFMEGMMGISLLLLIPVIYLGFYFEKHWIIPKISRLRNQLDT